MRVCLECYGDEEIERVGEDYLDVCPSCRSVEQGTYELGNDEAIEVWDRLDRKDRHMLISLLKSYDKE